MKKSVDLSDKACIAVDRFQPTHLPCLSSSIFNLTIHDVLSQRRGHRAAHAGYLQNRIQGEQAQ